MLARASAILHEQRRAVRAERHAYWSSPPGTRVVCRSLFCVESPEVPPWDGTPAKIPSRGTPWYMGPGPPFYLQMGPPGDHPSAAAPVVAA